MNIRRILILALAIGAVGSTTAALSLRSRYKETKMTVDASTANARVIAQYFSLEPVKQPSRISSFWLMRATENFRDAPIHIVLFGDPLCSDCHVLFEQLQVLEKEFAGKINLAYQFFPLEARCNDVVPKNKHPGACELSYMMAARPDSFRALHDEIVLNMDSAKTPGWQQRFARRHGLESALTDSALIDDVRALIRTGTEYERTSPKYPSGIRSTPTLIVNDRMIIGTLPLAHLRAIFQALVDAKSMEQRRFIESWINPGCSIDSEAQQCSATN